MESRIKTVAIIYNPVATGFKKAVLEQLTEKLNARGYKTETVESRWAGHVVPLVKQYNPLCDLIISMGGDGTIGECFQGFYNEEQHALYTHLPMGAANDSVKNFRLVKKDPFSSLDKILSGEVKDVDVLTVNGDPFNHASAFGFLMNIPYDTPRSLKYRLGQPAYILYAVKEFVKLPRKFQIKYVINGEEYEDTAVIVLVSNSNNFSDVEIFKDVKLDDGLFEVLFIRRITLKVIKQVISDCLKGGINFPRYGDAFKTFLTDEITIFFNNDKRRMDIDNDGEKYPLDRGDLKLHFRTDGKIKMLLPTESNAMVTEAIL